MRRGRDPELVDLAGASLYEVAWSACRECGRRCGPGHSTTAPTAAGLCLASHRGESSDRELAPARAI